MTERPYEVACLDDLDRIPVGRHGLLWRPVRRRLGIEAFGVNAYTADETGQEVDPIRNDPRFESAVAGKPDAGGEPA